MSLHEHLKDREDHDRKRRATLTMLLRELPLREVCNAIGVALPERTDLRAHDMQPMMRKLNDAVWPLVDVDTSFDDDRRE